MENQTVNIRISGEAGHGLQTIGPLLAVSLVRSGFSVHTEQTFESRVRGGHSTFSIRTGSKKILAPSEIIDLLLCLDEKNFIQDRTSLADQGLIIGNQEWEVKDKRFVGVPFSTFGKPLYHNVAGIGVLSALLGLDQNRISRAVKEKFSSDTAAANIDIMVKAYHWTEEKSFDFKKLSGASTPGQKLLIDCNESVAFGALSGGIKFCAFYPMSPSTSIPQTLINVAEKMDIIVEQAEDELAAINMALGASYCGAPALVATSGGGFALMTEAVSLAGISETPVVIVVGQRPGPGTGLPTRTEQGDLWLVLHGGHGEFPRAVFAPGDVEECFHLTGNAVRIAEKYQIPVIVLTDHYLSGSYQDLEIIEVERIPFVRPGKDASGVSAPYLRYKLTEDGISPRLLPGQGPELVIADSHEHTEDGHITEDLSFRPKMVEKRLRKLSRLTSETIAPTFNGDKNPDLLLVSWGSTKGAMLESAEKLKKNITKVGTLHFSQVWPIKPDQFIHFLNGSRQVVCIEGNAGAHFAQLIRRETGFSIERRICRYDGLCITPEYILKHLEG